MNAVTDRMPTSRNGRLAVGCGGLLGLCFVAMLCSNLVSGGKPPATQVPTAAAQPLMAATVAQATEEPRPTEAATEEPTVAATDVPTEEPTAVPPTIAPTQPPAPTAAPQPTAVPPTAAPPTEAAVTSNCININTASFDELRQITEVEEDIANQILKLRPFSGWPDLVRRVKGIGNNNVKNIQAQGLACIQ